MDFSKYPNIEDLIAACHEYVSKHGGPARFYVLNEKRMQDMNEAAAIMRKVVDESECDLDFNVIWDECDPADGSVEVRGYDWYVWNGASLIARQEAEELADVVSLGVSDDGKFIYSLDFKNIMQLKRIVLPN